MLLNTGRLKTRHRGLGSRRMKANGLIIAVILLFSTCLVSWYLVRTPTVSCNVYASDGTSGYYAAYGGVYVHRGHQISTIYDIHSVPELQKFSSSLLMIQMVQNQWIIAKAGQPLYRNAPSHPSDYLDYPPSTGWVSTTTMDNGGDSVIVKDCVGSLQDGPSINRSQPSNIEEAMSRPVTVMLLILLFYIAYYLYANNVDVSSVAFSYDLVVNQGEYWRMWTSSFSHFSILHLGFNTYTLYQFAELETIYGSMVYAYLSLDLVWITMIILVLMHHIMITKFNR